MIFDLKFDKIQSLVQRKSPIFVHCLWYNTMAQRDHLFDDKSYDFLVLNDQLVQNYMNELDWDYSSNRIENLARSRLKYRYNRFVVHLHFSAASTCLLWSRKCLPVKFYRSRIPDFKSFIYHEDLEKQADLRDSFVLVGVTPLWLVAQWVSRAPLHRTLPAFLYLNGTKTDNLVHFLGSQTDPVRSPEFHIRQMA